MNRAPRADWRAAWQMVLINVGKLVAGIILAVVILHGIALTVVFAPWLIVILALLPL